MQSDYVSLLVRIAHFVNAACILLLIRSGLQILADHPKLYWTDHTEADNYWLKFGRKKMPKDRLWTSADETETIGAYALPGGHHNLGAARNWHFATAIVWLLTGAIYWTDLFVSGQWRQFVPTDLGFFPRLADTLHHYLLLQAPPLSDFRPFDPLQQLAYGAVIFLLAPFMLVTALGMSPAFVGRFPGYLKLFGGRRQVARSLHFLGMVAFAGFVVVHVTMVFLVYFYHNVKAITLGSQQANLGLALTLFAAGILALIIINVWASLFTLGHQMLARRRLTRWVSPAVHGLLGRLGSRQRYTKKDISSFFRVNGEPPQTAEFKRLQQGAFADWRLKVGGLVEAPLELSLAEIKALPKQEQITKHHCIQGWSAVAEWGGVRMSEIINRSRPDQSARYVVFYGYDADDEQNLYYEVLRLEDMLDSQTILAYEMNWQDLPLAYGAPLRLRCERKLGYKMVKYLRQIDFIDNFENLGLGQGGYREDTQYYDWEAAI